MVDVQTSSLRDWLTFNGSLQTGPQPCQVLDRSGGPYPLVNVDCSQVCNDSRWLFSSVNGTSNLVTCGQWSSLMNGWVDAKSSGNLAFDLTGALDEYKAVGLDASDAIFLPGLDGNSTQPQISSETSVGRKTIYADIISYCLQEFYQFSQYTSSVPDPHSIPTACTTSRLFVNQFSDGPVDTVESLVEPMTSSLNLCLDAICSQQTLNTELVGIGVFASFFIQSAIALIAALSLVVLASWSTLSDATRNVHTRRIIAATVDFHKAQCYFASTIQITALILESQTARAFVNFFARKIYLDQQYNLADIADITPLALTALLPNSLVISCIARYSRLSWYMAILSLVTMVLGTASLATSVQISKNFDRLLTGDGISLRFQNYITIDKCSVTKNPSSILFAMCGSEYTNRILSSVEAYHHLSKSFSVISTWIIWFLSIAAISICVLKKAVNNNRRPSSPFLPVFERITRSRRIYPILMSLALLLWPLCFGAQFYLYYTFFQANLISHTWTFGQIIAVAVWVPSLVEFAYIQYMGLEAASKYRYPSPVKTTERQDHGSMDLANLEPARSNNEAMPATSSEQDSIDSLRPATTRDQIM